MDPEWFVYIIEAENGRLYTGITKDPDRRWGQHQEGTGAKFFRSSPPKSFLMKAGKFDRSTALRLEWRIKALSRLQKLELCKRGGFRRFYRALVTQDLI
jgi:putative endonuclease